jgi:hypothetical protein
MDYSLTINPFIAAEQEKLLAKLNEIKTKAEFWELYNIVILLNTDETTFDVFMKVSEKIGVNTGDEVSLNGVDLGEIPTFDEISHLDSVVNLFYILNRILFFYRWFHV